MKKFLALFLVLVLVLSMAACAGNNDTADTSTDDSSTTTEGDKTITIAGLYPLTGSAANSGKTMQYGIDFFMN